METYLTLFSNFGNDYFLRSNLLNLISTFRKYRTVTSKHFTVKLSCYNKFIQKIRTFVKLQDSQFVLFIVEKRSAKCLN